MRVLFFLFLAIGFLSSFGQSTSDTLSITLREADEIILKRNLTLIAAQFNVNANDALIQQAKLWDNPILNTDQNIYDGKYFRHDNTGGTFYLQLVQTIRTAGKRGYSTAIASDGQQVSKQQFYDMVRLLRYTVHSDLIELSHLTTLELLYRHQVEILSKLDQAMDAQYKAGNVSLKENLRVKATLFGMKHELSNLLITMNSFQAELRLILQLKDNVVVSPQVKQVKLSTLRIPSLDSLINSAMTSRPDLKISSTRVTLLQDDFNLQKALAVPDFNTGFEFDQHNSYAHNFYGLSISMALPVLNRNQGNIKAAKMNVNEQVFLDQETQSKIRNEVINAYNNYLIYTKTITSDYTTFLVDYQNIFNKMIESYSARQISLLELIDYLDAYKETQLQNTELKTKLLQAAEDINNVTNSTFIDIY
ncbi:MAG: TolC family protein [Bacteroidetes bacterium]|nr:TolC family protein [Bacteroidota bacterium]